MKLTPIDITNQTFSRKVMGLDPAEVSEFLHQMSSQVESLIQEKNHLKEILRDRELSLLEHKERDKILKDSIANATAVSEKMVNDAEREAKLILADAHQKAELIMRDSHTSLKKVYQDLADLKKTRIQFEMNMRAMVQAHLSLLEQGEKFLPQMQMNNYSVIEPTVIVR